MGAGLLAAGRRLLDVILPPHCLACGVTVDEPGSLCPGCWDTVTFLGPPACARCGLPFEFDVGEGTLCAACIRRPPVYERARAVFAYDDASRDMILGFKHADRTEAAPAFGRWLARAGAELIGQADLVAPVPLHWTRLWRRRYNQSALLARALVRLARPGDRSLAVIPDLLVRRRRTPSQGGLGAAQRARNVRGAFRVNPRFQARLRGARVLLVDDVFTTGATVEACARVLLRAGAGAVDVLTLARVVRPRTE
ncbi:MAG: amidophosphoribosyltransferase [Rhodospirillales bacterium CG15_BIG_FIL_POST_REV_8_21_14_020_66_15]|nr:MAG: amidophosphoribosyltransferase [Rhodospirillales bacterium CG15_BIG_FIL_POST_REV_8_21_14_020_66_15]